MADTRGGRGKARPQRWPRPRFRHAPPPPPVEQPPSSCSFTVAGLWSEAGICTTVHLTYKKLSVVFDMGICPPQVRAASHIFISHGHLDHCAGMISHARIRSMDSGPSAKYYMPPYLIGPADEARQAFEKLNGAPIPMEFVSIGPGDEVSLGEGCRVRAFPTAHRVSSQGYAILQTKRRGLMPQFRDLSPEELRDLAKQGVVLNEMETTVEVVYTGDTVMAPLIQEPLIWQAKLLIIEVTYLEGSCDSAVKYQHIHVNDLKTVAHMVHSEMVVICHTSSRYSPKAVRSLLQEALPETLLSRVWLAQRGLYQVLSSPIQPWKAAR